MKKKLLIALLWVLAIGVLLSLMPWHRNISVQTIAYEYALDRQEPLRTHEVTVEGKYYPNIWRGTPYFDGSFAVSGFPFSLEEPVRISFHREETDLGMLYYRDEAGQPRSREINQYRGKKDFTEFIVMLFEIEEADGKQTGSWNPETGHILCTDAPDYEAMQAQCREVGFDLWEVNP